MTGHTAPSHEQDRHTPGPWSVTVHGIMIYGPSYDIGAVRTPPSGDPERMANARLIAAAPDLLKALIELTSNAEHANRQLIPSELSSSLFDTIDQAQAAIAKATGQANAD